MENVYTIQVDLTSDEKRLHIQITPHCNSNCVFCFSTEDNRSQELSFKEIQKTVADGYKKGYRTLILSGGEPTLHPQFNAIVRYAKKIGYNNVKTITNGRIFAYQSFTQYAKKAGLDEVTVSLHSHKEQVHDMLTRTPGSYRQAIKGIKTCNTYSILVSINVVLNKMNISHLPKIVGFLASLGVKNISIENMIPFGSGWKNKQLIVTKTSIKQFKKAISVAEKNGVRIRFNRFSYDKYKVLSEYIQDRAKLVNEVRARIDEFQKVAQDTPLSCYPKRCAYCYMHNFCRELHESAKKDTDVITFVQEYIKR